MKGVVAALVAAVALAAAAPAGALAPGEVTNLAAAPGTFTPLQATAGTSGLSLLEASRAVSAGGRYVVFTSSSDAMVADTADDTTSHVYRRDTQTGQTILISRATGANGAVGLDSSNIPSVSADGNRVAFITSSRLDPGADTNDHGDVYVRDVLAQTTTLASRASGAGAVSDLFVPTAEISGDGQFVVFSTAATNLLGPGGDNDGSSDVFRRGLGPGDQSTILVSRTTGGANLAGGAFDGVVNHDGTRVALVSSALLATEAAVDGSGTDIYLRTITGPGPTDGTTAQISRSTAGVDTAFPMSDPSINADGDRVAFSSPDLALHADDTSTDTDVFLHEDGEPLALVSRRTGETGVSCDGECRAPVLSDDGPVAVVTFFSNDAAINGALGQHAVQRRMGDTFTTNVVSRAPGAGGARATVASIGAARTGIDVAFSSSSNDVSPDDSDDFPNVFVRRPQPAPDTVFVSRPSGFGPIARGLNDTEFRENDDRAFSADGRFVAFVSDADGLLPPEALPFSDDEQVFRRDLLTGQTILVSRGNGPTFAGVDEDAESVSISADGRYVAFGAESVALAQSFGAFDDDHVYRHDTQTGQTILVSRADGANGAPATEGTQAPIAMSADGDRIAFESRSPDLPATQPTLPDPGVDHIFVRVISTGRTILVSRATGAGGAQFAGPSQDPALSADGTRVAFTTDTDELDGNALTADPLQIVMRDLGAGTTSVLSDAPGGALGNDESTEPALSDDGNRVLFVSNATNFHPDDTASGNTAYIVDLPAGTPQPAGRADGAAGAVDSNGNNDLRLSPDGRFVAFSTVAPLDAADTNGILDVYLRDTQLNTTRRVSLGTGGVQLTAPASAAGISRDGRCVMFETDDGAIQPGTPVSQDFTLLAVRAVTADCPVPAPLVVPPAPPAPGPAADTTPPGLTNVSLTRTRFRVVGVRVRPQPGRRLTPAGSVLRLRLSESARVRLVFERRAKGKRVNRRCLAPTRARAKRPNCIRFLAAGALTRPTLAAGARRIPITGKVGRRALRPGSYRLSVTAIDAAGNRSAVRRVTFTIVRR